MSSGKTKAVASKSAKKRTAAKSGRPRGYHHGDLRAALLEAAVAVVKAQGPDAVSMRDIARRAGVSEAAPYHHFESRTHILAVAAARGFRELDAVMAAHEQQAGDDPRRRLVAVGAAYVRFALQQPGYFRLMFGAHVEESLRHVEEARGAGAAVTARVRETVAAFLAACAPKADPTNVLRAVWAQAHGVAWLVHGRELHPEPDAAEAIALVEETVGLLLDGLAARS